MIRIMNASRKNKKVTTIGLICLLLAFGQSSAQAALVSQCGDTVCFTWDDTALSIFGTPDVVGDKIIFDPTTFVAKSLNGEGVVTTNATVNITIDAMAGYAFDSMSMSERGDYFLWGTNSGVSVGGQLRVRDDADTMFVTDSITPSAPFNIFNTPLDLTTHNWDAAAAVSLAGAEWDGVTQVVMKVENILSAYTQSGDDGELQAFIEKKSVGVEVDIITTVIPVPAAIWLFGSGLLSLVGMARRKKA